MWNHFYIEIHPHFLSKQLFSLGKKSGIVSYIEMFPHFLKQLFSLGKKSGIISL